MTAALVAVATIALAMTLMGCSQAEQTGTTDKVIDVTDEGALGQMTVVEVTRGDEAPQGETGQSGDYLNIAFRVDNSENANPIELHPLNFAILWGNTAQKAWAANPDVVVDAGETTKFTYTFVLSMDGEAEGITSSEDVELFYSRNAIEIPDTLENSRDVQDLRKSADEHGMLSDYWIGSLEP